MEIFAPTLNQMGFFFALIAAGFLLSKLKVVDQSAASILSKLENTIFVPALILVTFIDKVNIKTLTACWKPFFIGIIFAAVTIPLGLLLGRLITKDPYQRNIYSYGLIFANFGFMGNALVSALFPDYFFEYLIFTLPPWMMIYLWAVPALLISDSGKLSIKDRLKSFLNPMFFAILIGVVLGLLQLPMPKFIGNTLEAASGCMSPIAMLLTGITIANANFKKTFTDFRIYLASLLRLAVLPLATILILYLLPFEIADSTKICAVCMMAMPLGLNTIVVPGAYGKDTTVAAGMAILSHLLSCISIPLIMMLAFKILF